MPDGVVQWFDATQGTAAIVRAGRVFPTSAADVESPARHPGAHVHFDVARDNGVERAVHVRLREGTRVSRTQGRFGTLTGARRPDVKRTAPVETLQPDLGLSPASHPLEVARAWVTCLQTRSLDRALALYAPDARVHAPDGDHAGRGALHAYLESSPLLGIPVDPEVRGDGVDAMITWPADGLSEPVEVRCRVEHGRLVEQWIGPPALAERVIALEGAEGIELAVVTHGPVGDNAVRFAQSRIAPLLERIGDPVLFARVKLTHAADPARPRPELAEVAVDVNGELVRAHVAAHEMHEAIDLLEQRLRDKLLHRASRRDWLRTARSAREEGEWRHGDLPTARPDYYARARDERMLVRHKTFDLAELTPDEAAFDMDLLDYDFHLFRDLASGDDALLERLPGGTFRLHRVYGDARDAGPAAIPLVVEPQPAPVSTVGDAIERLDDGGERFVFFRDAGTGRGSVVYRRYDGHYGLITAA